MDKLEQIYENYKKSKNDLAKYFGLEKIPALCDIGDINESYWFVDNQSCLNFAEEKEDFETGHYYCLDSCNDEICGRYEAGRYVALQVGCGEHYNGRFEIFRKDREIEEPKDLY
jgi:hypothetical protein